MNRRLFTEQDITPNDTLLGKHLGLNLSSYFNIIRTSSELHKRWQFIQGNGWLLRVDDNEKAMYYLIACEDGIIVNLTVNELEMTALQNDENLIDIRGVLNASKKYSDVYALSFEIKNEEESRSVANFLSIHIKTRKAQNLIKKSLYPKAKQSIKKIKTVH